MRRNTRSKCHHTCYALTPRARSISRSPPPPLDLSVVLRCLPSDALLNVHSLTDLSFDSQYYSFDKIFPPGVSESILFQGIQEEVFPSFSKGVPVCIFSFGCLGFPHSLVNGPSSYFLQLVSALSQSESLSISVIEFHREKLYDMLNEAAIIRTPEKATKIKILSFDHVCDCLARITKESFVQGTYQALTFKW